MESVIGIILGGGAGSRLYPLTKYRSKPAVPIGGKYRLIDIPISNCLHSGLTRIYALTQFNSASLNRHIAQTYRFDAFSNGFVEILAAEQTEDRLDWYQGTADAVRQQLRHFMSYQIDQYLILSGDHLYRMNYRDFIAEHREKRADLTIAVKPVTREIAPDLGILKLDDTGRIIDFVEKPQTAAELDDLKLDPTPGNNPDEAYMASMGIYVFEKDKLRALLAENSGDDFGKHIIPAAIHSHNVYAHRFEGYWEDIGTIRAFYESNLALTTPSPPFTFYQPDAPIYTHPRYLAAAKLDGCHLKQCKIGDGSDIQDAEIEHAVIGIRSIVGPRVKLTNTVMMGADFYETPEDRKRNKQKGIPNVGIGPGCVIDSAIIDKNARIGENVIIQNAKNIREAEHDAYAIRDGIVVITKDAIIPAGTVI